MCKDRALALSQVGILRHSVGGSLGGFMRRHNFGLANSVAVVFCGFACLFGTASAQTERSNPSAPSPPLSTMVKAGQANLLSDYEFWLTISVLIFGLMALIIGMWSVSRTDNPGSEQFIRVMAVVLIVIGTLVTITAGLSDKQIAPAFGLFGTIAGYLLGRSDRAKDRDGSLP